MCECISPLSVYLPSHISPLTHTHRYRINTHRAATSGFHLPALHVSNGYVFSSPPLPAQTWICGKADTHTRHTHTQTHANTHSHTEFSIPFAATSTPTSPPPLFSNLILSLEKMNFALFVGIFSRFLVGQYILVDVAKVRRALW